MHILQKVGRDNFYHHPALKEPIICHKTTLFVYITVLSLIETHKNLYLAMYSFVYTAVFLWRHLLTTLREARPEKKKAKMCETLHRSNSWTTEAILKSFSI